MMPKHIRYIYHWLAFGPFKVEAKLITSMGGMSDFGLEAITAQDLLKRWIVSGK